MPSPVEDLKFFNPGTGEGWTNALCPHCSVNAQMFVLAQTSSYSPHVRTAWVRCVNCFRGAVINVGVGMSPTALPLGVPVGVEEQAAATWEEARKCLSASAFTASVMMCRKLLMHMAVKEGLPEKDAKEKAPTFVACMNHLEDEGVITKRNRSWAEKIKDIGNEANHDLASIGEQQATTVAKFTYQLLREVYELPYLERQELGEQVGDGNV